MSNESYPVVGALRQYVNVVTGEPIGGGFEEFETATVQGLMRVRDGTLDILAIGAKRPGRGDGARFIIATQAKYRRIRFLHVMNVEFGAMLERNGFVKGCLYEDGETIATLEWARP